MAHVCARVIASTDVFGTGDEGIVVRMGELMDKLREDLTASIRYGPCATYVDLVSLLVADFTVASTDTFIAPCARAVPTGEAVSPRGNMLMDLNVAPAGSVPLPAEDGNAEAIEKAIAYLIGYISPSHPSPSHAVNVPSLAVSDDD